MQSSYRGYYLEEGEGGVVHVYDNADNWRAMQPVYNANSELQARSWIDQRAEGVQYSNAEQPQRRQKLYGLTPLAFHALSVLSRYKLEAGRRRIGLAFVTIRFSKEQAEPLLDVDFLFEEEKFPDFWSERYSEYITPKPSVDWSPIAKKGEYWLDPIVPVVDSYIEAFLLKARRHKTAPSRVSMSIEELANTPTVHAVDPNVARMLDVAGLVEALEASGLLRKVNARG